MRKKVLQRKGRRVSERKRREIDTKLLVTLTFIAVIIIVTVVLMQPQTRKLKVDPNKYFAFQDASALGYYPKNTSNVVRIRAIHFKIVPIGGDANNVIIFMEGMVNPANYHYPKIKNGTEQAVEIILPSEIQIRREEKGYPLKIRIYSDETEGYVTIWLSEEDILLVP